VPVEEEALIVSVEPWHTIGPLLDTITVGSVGLAKGPADTVGEVHPLSTVNRTVVPAEKLPKLATPEALDVMVVLTLEVVEPLVAVPSTV
jgi:nitrate reductase alpha subunit